MIIRGNNNDLPKRQKCISKVSNHHILRARAATCNQRKVNNLELYDKLTVTNGTNFPSRKFNSVGKFCIRFGGKKLDICFSSFI